MDVVEVINQDVTRVLSGLKGEVVHIDSWMVAADGDIGPCPANTSALLMLPTLVVDVT